MKIEEATHMAIEDIWEQVSSRVERAIVLEGAAQTLVNELYAHWKESIVLARMFVTVPYGKLPEENMYFVRSMAESADAAEQLKADTPVLSLIGTHGRETDWNDRHNSKGHKGIPLISAAFVKEIPMMTRLLLEMGVPVQWVDVHDLEFLKKLGSGLFYVEDAAEEVDMQGRKIIPAQDFVNNYNIQTVFGSGGPYPNGEMAILIVFSNELLSRNAVMPFLALSDSFKNATAHLAKSGKIFA